MPSKAALRDAVAEGWLASVSKPLAAVPSEEVPAPERLRRWLDLLIESKRSRALKYPELFATYVKLAGESREVITAQVGTLTEQLTVIIADGAQQGEFAVADPAVAARAIFDATSRFHNRSTLRSVRPGDRRGLRRCLGSGPGRASPEHLVA